MSQSMKIDCSVQTQLILKHEEMISELFEIEQAINNVERLLGDFFIHGNVRKKLIEGGADSIEIYRLKMQQMLRTFEISHKYVYQTFQTIIELDKEIARSIAQD